MTRLLIFLFYDFVMVFLTGPMFPPICLKIAVIMCAGAPLFALLLYFWPKLYVPCEKK